MTTLLNTETDKKKSLLDQKKNIDKEISDEEIKQKVIEESDPKGIPLDIDDLDEAPIEKNNSIVDTIIRISDNNTKNEEYKENLRRFGYDEREIEIHSDEENSNPFLKDKLQNIASLENIVDEETLKTMKEKLYSSPDYLHTNPEITRPMKQYWDNIMYEFSDWAVGTDADWGTYFERGLGKSNINLALQYHADLGIDYEKVFTAEPDDTGALERLAETITGIFADLPTFGIGGAIGAYTTRNIYGAAFGAGFFNDTIKEMYFQALESDTPPDSFMDWWNVFSHHGISSGIEGGLNMVGLVGGQRIAAKTIGRHPLVNKFISDFIGRFAGLTLMGTYLNNELPGKDEMVNNALMLSLFGSVESLAGNAKGSRSRISKKSIDMVNESAKLNKVSHTQKTLEILDSIPLLKELFSKNTKHFRKDKEALKEEAQHIKNEIEIARKQEIDAAKTREVLHGEKGLNIKEVIKEIETTTKDVPKQTAIQIIEHIRQSGTAHWRDIKKTFKLDANKAQEILSILEKHKFVSKEKIGGVRDVMDIQSINLYKIKILSKIRSLNESIMHFKSKEQTPEVVAKIKELARERDVLVKDARRQGDTIGVVNRLNQLYEKYWKLTGERIEPPTPEFYRYEGSKKSEKFVAEVVGMKDSKGKGKTYERKEFAADFIDRQQPIKVIADKIAETKGIKNLSNNRPLDIYEAMRIQPGMIGKAQQFLEVGVLKFETGTNAYVGKSFFQILDKHKAADLKPDGGLNYYLIGKQVIAIYNAKKGTAKQKREETKKETGVDIVNARDFVRREASKFEQTAKELAEYQKSLIDYLYDGGFLPKTMYKEFVKNIMEKDYIPLRRDYIRDIFSEGQGKAGPGMSGSLKKRKGSERPIISPLESIHSNTLHFISMAERNHAIGYFFRTVADFQKKYPGKDLGYKIEKAIPKIKSVKLTKKEREQIEDALGKEQGVEIFRTDGHLKPEGGGGIVQYYEKGKLVQYKVADRVLFNAFKDLNFAKLDGYTGAPIFEMALSAGRTTTKLLRAGITLDPRFMLANGIRDTFTAALYSKNKGFIVGLSTYQGAKKYIKARKKKEGKEKDLYDTYVRSGANQAQLLSIDKNYFDIPKSQREYLKHKQSTYQNVIDFAKNPNLDFLRNLGNIFESASRIQNVELSMKRMREENAKLPPEKRMTEREIEQRVGFEGRDITIDFRKMGTAVKLINQQAAFYNANIQGWTKMYEAFKDRMPGTINRNTAPFFFKRGIQLITLPSIALWFFNKDSQVYKDLSQFEKDMFWIIIMNEGKDDQWILRIPKPFELGIAFGSFPERMLDWAYHSDDKSIKKTMDGFVNSLGQLITPDVTLLKPFFELAVNERKIGTEGVPLVNSRLEKLLPKDRYKYDTSLVSKVLSYGFAEFNDLIGREVDTYPSPIAIDHIYKGYTGQLGQYFLDFVDAILLYLDVDEKLNVRQVVPKSDNVYIQMQDWPIFRGFLTTNKKVNNRYIQNFYDEYKAWEKRENSYKAFHGTSEESTSDNIGRILDDILSEETYFEGKTKEEVKQKYLKHHYQGSYLPKFHKEFKKIFKILHSLDHLNLIRDEKWSDEEWEQKQEEWAHTKYEIIDNGITQMLILGRVYEETRIQMENAIDEAQKEAAAKKAQNFLEEDGEYGRSVSGFIDSLYNKIIPRAKIDFIEE
jgi:hypothetical protein